MEWHFLEMHNQMHTAPYAYRAWIENESQEISTREEFQMVHGPK